MRKLLYFFILTLVFSCSSKPKGKELSNIKIARDVYGVPHIMAKTDAEVAYGLAWTQCEDDFVTFQELMAACKGMLGEIKGQDGLVADFGIKFMGLKEIADKKYNTDVTGDFKKYLESFVAGVNAYATLHPEKVLLDDLFPLTGADIITGYLLGNLEVSHAGDDLKKILGGTIIKDLKSDVPKGSNAFAFSKNKTTDGKTYLAVNSHQPLEGWYSWYEAHLISEEGLNILGGTFAGGICIFHGANENLGWAHTVNHADFSDVYQLEMNPEKEGFYKFDDEWLELTEKKYWSWLKFGPIKIPISRTIYSSKYGPTFKTDTGVFAWRFVVGQSIKMAEQWFRMNKASNFKEFKEALEMRGIAALNIVYADKEDNIYYVSNGSFPERNPDYDWSKVLPGNTSKTLWNNTLVPFDSLPQVLNPSSGWVFNTNNSPFSATDSVNNFKETTLNKRMGYQITGMENNRSNRFLELMEQYDSISYEDFKTIKYDNQYPKKMMTRTALNLENLMHLNPSDYPEISDAITLLNTWDRKTDKTNKTAALYILTWMHLNQKRIDEGREVRRGSITLEDCVFGITKAKDELLKNYSSLQIELGELQRHTRGNVNLPIGGAPDVLAAIYAKKVNETDKTYRAFAGESHIELIRFGENGVELETINSYGSNANIGDKHSTSQMEDFTNYKLKKMTLNKEEVLKNAVKIYSPMEVVK
ncbi:penicillin acylase family protein [Tenacibaculum sp. 1_MG-2023]|uniref:penicillin acylase family protein n=1 Tax=Tenacibaculum sp. 1_MG-2023 TaxID=3062653 RepID=UPI0026E119A4|nr:penicillin acylase family protein [Tenacibaculum sp. 1_MG-2023]MDO6599043.1 penicillin acylase family protein [Tenacibaculum sp. 1_MG-2023]